MAFASGTVGTRLRQRQRRASVPAWGNAPGIKAQAPRGLKVRPSRPSCAIHRPSTHDAERMERAVGAYGLFVGMDLGLV